MKALMSLQSKLVSMVCLIGYLLLFSSFASAEKLSVAQAQQFMYLSGLDETIAALPEQVQQQINLKSLFEKDPQTHDKISRVVGDAVHSVDAKQLALDYLINRKDSEGLIHTLAFLESPLGKKVVSYESAMNKPESQVEMQQYMMEMSSNPPSSTRIDLIHDLTAALHMEQTMVDMIKGMMFSVVSIMEELEPESSVLVKEMVEQEWTQIEGVLEKQFSQYVTLASHFSYRELTDQELQDYITFLKSDDGQVYWQASIDIFNLFLKEFIKSTVVKASAL